MPNRSWTRGKIQALLWGGFALWGCTIAGCGGVEEHSKVIDPSNQDLDVLSNGPLQILQGEYQVQSEEREDAMVLPGAITDLRAALTLPEGPGPYPLAVFLHGNHSTCGRVQNPGGPRVDSSSEFTSQGACPEGMVEAPSYRGYDYLATHLASHGYVVVSINANRGITGDAKGPDDDPFLIVARGRLVLKHLAWLAQWNDGRLNSQEMTGLDLAGKIDFSHVGFMGHSRGGEGVRAAYSLYQNSAPNSYASQVPAINVEGIFELRRSTTSFQASLSTRPVPIGPWS